MSTICPKCGQPQERCTCNAAGRYQPNQPSGAMPPYPYQQPQQPVMQQQAPQGYPQQPMMQQPYPQQGYPQQPVMQQPAPKPKTPLYTTSAEAGPIRMAKGEQTVREFMLGKYPGGGTSTVTVTNRRVILREKYQFLFLSNDHVEEQNLDSVDGVFSSLSRTVSPRLLTSSLIGLVTTILLWILAGTFGSMRAPAGIVALIVILGLVTLLFSVGRVALAILFPTATFGLTTSSDTRSLVTGINTKGRMALGEGSLLRFRPTDDTAKVLEEAGACISDLKRRGDEAIKDWKK